MAELFDFFEKLGLSNKKKEVNKNIENDLLVNTINNNVNNISQNNNSQNKNSQNNNNETNKLKKTIVRKKPIVKKSKQEFDNNTVSSTESETKKIAKSKSKLSKKISENNNETINSINNNEYTYIKVKNEKSTDKDTWEFDNRLRYKGVVLNVPEDVPKDLLEKSKCAVYIEDIDKNISGWKKGIIKDIDKRKKYQENVTIELKINNKKYIAKIIAKKINYGPDRTWILI
jgi:hypothetical protein